MKRTALYIIIAVILIVLIAVAFRRDEGGAGAADRIVSGTVTSVDLDQAMFDGPYVVLVESDKGSEETIHVPSMGIMLCAAREAIASPSELKEGDLIEVRGSLTAEGVIVPCESAGHYLRIRDAE